MSTCVLFIDSACLFQYFCHCIVRDKSFFIRGVEGGGGGGGERWRVHLGVGVRLVLVI